MRAPRLCVSQCREIRSCYCRCLLVWAFGPRNFVKKGGAGAFACQLLIRARGWQAEAPAPPTAPTGQGLGWFFESVLGFPSAVTARFGAAATRSLTLGALIRAPTVREGLPPTAQYHAVRDLAGYAPFMQSSRNWGLRSKESWSIQHCSSLPKKVDSWLRFPISSGALPKGKANKMLGKWRWMRCA